MAKTAQLWPRRYAAGAHPEAAAVKTSCADLPPTLQRGVRLHSGRKPRPWLLSGAFQIVSRQRINSPGCGSPPTLCLRRPSSGAFRMQTGRQCMRKSGPACRAAPGGHDLPAREAEVIVAAEEGGEGRRGARAATRNRQRRRRRPWRTARRTVARRRPPPPASPHRLPFNHPPCPFPPLSTHQRLLQVAPV